MKISNSKLFERINIRCSTEQKIINKVQLSPPKMYKVILHNDDYTSMEFVIYILITYFNVNHDQAMKMMLNIHTKGSEICGIYTFEIAETKQIKVSTEAENASFPLLCTIEEE